MGDMDGRPPRVLAVDRHLEMRRAGALAWGVGLQQRGRRGEWARFAGTLDTGDGAPGDSVRIASAATRNPIMRPAPRCLRHRGGLRQAWGRRVRSPVAPTLLLAVRAGAPCRERGGGSCLRRGAPPGRRPRSGCSNADSWAPPDIPCGDGVEHHLSPEGTPDPPGRRLDPSCGGGHRRVVGNRGRRVDRLVGFGCRGHRGSGPRPDETFECGDISHLVGAISGLPSSKNRA